MNISGDAFFMLTPAAEPLSSTGRASIVAAYLLGNTITPHTPSTALSTGPKTRTIIFSLPWIVIVMCLAVPGLVESIEGRTAIVDFGGVKREAIIDLMEEGTIVPGVYVLVHTGFVIQKLEKEEALETLAIWREVLSAAEEP